MKNKNMKRIIVLLILILIIGVSIKCCTHKDIDNSVFKNNEKTIESVQEEAKKDEVKKEEAKKEESKKDDKKEETKKPSTSGGKDNSGSTNKPSSGSNSSNSGNSSSTEKPAHKHNWVNVTKTVNHPAETHQEDVYEDRQVKVKDAWYEQVKTGTAQECRQCGFRTTDGNAMTEHMLENGHSCHTVYTYETVHHDAVYETQRVKVGTKTVTDKAAWTETVVTGQKCSSCGETK